MADKEYNVNISVTESGADKTSSKVSKIGKTAKNSSSGVNLLKNALGSLGAFLALDRLKNYSDSWTKINSIIKLSTKSTADYIKVQKALFNISTKTRTSISDNAKIFQRMSLAQKSLNLSQQEMLDITETVAKSLAVMGSSALESRGAMLQFSQALTTGKVRAEEMNSIMESLPVIAKLTADAIGVTTGELKNLVNAGVLSSKEFAAAILSQSDQMDVMFRDTKQTIGQTFTLLENEVLKFVGATGESSGAVQAFIDVLTLLAIHIDKVLIGVAIIGAITALLALKSIIVGVAGVTGIGALVSGIWSLVAALGGLALASVTSGTAFGVFGGIMSAVGVAALATGKVVLAAMGTVVGSILSVLTPLALVTAAFSTGFAVGEALSAPVELAVGYISAYFQKLISNYKALVAYFQGADSGTVSSILHSSQKLLELRLRKVDKTYEDATKDDFIARLGNSYKKQFDYVKNKVSEGGLALNEKIKDTFGVDAIASVKSGSDKLTNAISVASSGLDTALTAMNVAWDNKGIVFDFTKRIATAGLDTLIDKLKSKFAGYGDDIKSLLSQTVKEAKSDVENTLNNLDPGRADDALRKIRFLTSAKGVELFKNNIKKLHSELRPSDFKKYGIIISKAFKDIEDKSPAKAVPVLKKIEEKLIDLPRHANAVSAALGGMGSGFSKWTDEARDIYGVMENVTQSSLDRMADSITEFVETGKLDFRSLVADISKEMLKLSIKGALGQGLHQLFPEFGATQQAGGSVMDILKSQGSSVVAGPLTEKQTLASQYKADSSGPVNVVDTGANTALQASNATQTAQTGMFGGMINLLGLVVTSISTLATTMLTSVVGGIVDTVSSIADLAGSALTSIAIIAQTTVMVGMFSALIAVNATGFVSLAGLLTALIAISAIPFFQMGGNYTGNEPFIAGERGPELIVPNGSGSVVNNKDTEGGGGGTGSPAEIINIIDPSMAESYLNTPAGNKTIVNIISKHKTQLKGILN